MKQAKYCDYCGDIGGFHWPGCPQAQVERINTNTAGQHQPNCPDRIFGPDRTHYYAQPEQIIRPTEHADLLRLIDGLAQTLQRHGVDTGDESSAAVVSAAEMVIRRMEDDQ